jgi:hypothetical protein
VTNQNDMVQGWIQTGGVQFPKGCIQRSAQLQSGIPNRVPGAVAEGPELKALTEDRVALQVVEQVSPTARARCRAVDKYDWNFTRLIWLKADQLRAAAIEEIAAQEASVFAPATLRDRSIHKQKQQWDQPPTGPSAPRSSPEQVRKRGTLRGGHAGAPMPALLDAINL